MTVARELVTLLRYQLDKSGLSQYQKQATTAIGGMQKRVKAVGIGARDAFHGFNLGIRDGIREHGALNKAQSEAVKNVQQMGRGYSDLTRYVRLALGAFSVTKVLGYVDSWGQMESRMKQATASAEEYAAVDQDLARISRLTYKAYDDNAELFVRTRRTMADLGKTTQDTVDVTEALSLGMVLSSTKTANSENVIQQFSKAIMQGKLGLEEYQTLMAQAPRLQTALADGLGVTTAKLLEMVKAGKITTDKMLPALQSQLAKMRIEAEDMPVTIADAFTVLNNAAQRFFGKTLTAGRWAVLRMTKSIEYLADNIGVVVGLLGSGVIAYALSVMRLGALAAIGPWLRLAALAAGIYLVGEDMMVWAQGGSSVLGRMFGDKSEWQGTIDLIKYTLTYIKDQLGGMDQTLGLWLMKWGTIAVVGYAILSLSLGLGRALWVVLKPVRLLGAALFWVAATVLPLIVKELALIATTSAGRILVAWAAILFGLKWIYDNAGKIGAKLESAFTGALEKIGIKVDGLKEKFANLIPEPVKDILGNVIGKDVDALGGTNRESIDKLFGVKPGAMQKPQSYSPSQSNQITNETHIHAQTNSPAALANAAGAAVGRATERAVSRPSWGSPNVEAMA